jgi:ABC-type bacteriocin/lantibiotic exporter with double-glycine peptidase domain
MKRVVQWGEEGCGVACVAMVARISRNDAKRKMADQLKTGTTARQLREALRSFGVQLDKPRPIREKNYYEFDFDAVLHGFVEEEHPREWHWVVWDSKRRRTLDPYRYPVKFRCTSYIKIGM